MKMTLAQIQTLHAACTQLLTFSALQPATRLKITRVSQHMHDELAKVHAKSNTLLQEADAAVLALQAEYEAKAQAVREKAQAAVNQLMQAEVTCETTDLPEEEFTRADTPPQLIEALRPLLSWLKPSTPAS